MNILQIYTETYEEFGGNGERGEIGVWCCVLSYCGVWYVVCCGMVECYAVLYAVCSLMCCVPCAIVMCCVTLCCTREEYAYIHLKYTKE